jgi:hypothetical protein
MAIGFQEEKSITIQIAGEQGEQDGGCPLYTYIV